MNTSSPDFPLWLPSALVKELRQGLRTPSFSLLACIFPALLALLFLFSFIPNPHGEPVVGQEMCGALLWGALLVSLLFVTPMRAIASVRMELATRNYELLLLTRQTAGRIVLGKWVSFMAQALLIIFISLPFFIIRYYYGQIDLVNDFTVLIYIYLGSGMLTAFALWAAAQPVLLRVIAIFSLTATLVNTAVLSPNHIVEHLWSSALSTGIVLADAALVIATMLLLARTYFAPAAQNTSAALRRLLLAYFGVNLLLILLTANDAESLRETMEPQTIFLFFYGVFLLVIHLNTPAELLPVHVAQIAGKRFSQLRQFLFLPGAPSGTLLALLLTALGVASLLLLDRFKTSPGAANVSLTFAACIGVAAWYAVAAPALMLLPFQHKLKQYTLLAYLLLWVPFGLLLGIVSTLELSVPGLPGSDFLALIQLDDKNMVPADMGVTALINVAIIAALLFAFGRRWFARRKQAEKAVGQSPSNS